MKNKLTLIAVALIVAFLACCRAYNTPSIANGMGVLTPKQKDACNEIARVCIENFEEYKIYPSVVLGIFGNESTFGEHMPNYNGFGLQSGKLSFNSYEEATLCVLKNLNKHSCYKGIINNPDYKQCAGILNGTWCVGNPNYHTEVISLIESYNLTKYDNKLLKHLEKKKRNILRKQEFNVIYDPSLDENTIYVNKKLIGGANTVTVYVDDVLVGIMDLKKCKVDTDTVKTGSKYLCKNGKVTLEFYNAEG